MEEGNSRADSARGESFEAFEDVDPIREAAKARAEALRSRIAIVAGVAAITLGVALVAAPARESLRSDEESPTKPHATSAGTRSRTRSGSGTTRTPFGISRPGPV